MTTAPGTNNHPRWSPDGKSIAFVSSRGGSAQVWLLPVEGGEARQLTKLPIDVSGPIWSPRGDKIAFAAEVYPGKTPEETAAKDKEKEASKSKVRTFDHLMIRHWNVWDEGKRSHLFVADANTGVPATSRPNSRSTRPLPRSAARPTMPGRPMARSWPSRPSPSRTGLVHQYRHLDCPGRRRRVEESDRVQPGRRRPALLLA